MPAQLYSHATQMLKKVKKLQSYSESLSLQEKVILAYQEKVLTNLIPLVEPKDAEVAELKDFLNKNWQLVNGNALCYTALPVNELTLFFCEIVNYIVKNSKGETLYPLKLLMPSVSIYKFSDSPDNPSLGTDDLQGILKTHILGRSGTYLIPVEQLIKLAKSNSSQDKEWYNAYYDDEFHLEEFSYLQEVEFDRLANHSSSTKDLWDAHTQYNASIKEDSLLGQLKLLCHFLYLNDKDGAGTENEAGFGVYQVIGNFKNYYGRLGETNQNKIPPTLKEEIEELLELVTPIDDPNMTQDELIKANKDRQRQQLCIQVRRQQLLSEMCAAGDELLSQISLSEADEEEHRQRLKKKLQECEEQLTKAIQDPAYDGCDKLALTPKLMEALGVKYSISSVQDLLDLMRLRPEEIAALGQDESIQYGITKQIPSLADFILIATEISPAKLKELLALIKPYFIEELILSAEDLIALLYTVGNKDRCQVICEVMKEELLAFHGSAFIKVLAGLSPEHRTLIYEVIKDNWLQRLSSAYIFRNTFKLLSPAQGLVLYELVKDNLIHLIHTAWDFAALTFLSSEQWTVIYNQMEENKKWSKIITGPMDLVEVCRVLSPGQIQVLCQNLPHLPKIIVNIDDFISVLKLLASEQMKAFCYAIKENLPEIIRTGSNHFLNLEPLSSQERAVMYEAVKDNLPQIIRTGKDFRMMLQLLSSDYCTIVYEETKNRWAEILEDMDDLKCVLSVLSPEQQAAVYETIKNHWPHLIKNTSIFFNLYSSRPIHRTAIFEAFEQNKKWPQLIQDTADFVLFSLFSELFSEDQRAMVFKGMENNLSNVIIRHLFDLSSVFRWFSPEQIAIFCQAKKKELSRLIRTYVDLNTVIGLLEPEKQDVFCTAISEDLPKILPTASSFARVDGSHNVIYNAMQDHLPQMIQSVLDLRAVLGCLSSHNIKALCQNLPQLPNLIRGKYDFNAVVDWFDSPKQRAAFCEAIKENLFQHIPIKHLHNFLENFQCDKSKKKVHHLFFNHLLQELEKKIAGLQKNNSITACLAAKTLHTELTQVAKAFYDEGTINYPEFSKSCTSAINQARGELSHLWELLEFFAKLALTVLSLGTVPASVALGSRVFTGQWNPCLFPTMPVNSEATLNEIAGLCSVKNMSSNL